jgi:SAM-dependent methyltransferase
MDRLKPVSAAAAPCKICGGASPLFGLVDFNKSCAEAGGLRVPLAGVPIYYRRCGSCGFLFTDAFDDWSEEKFKLNIYNGDYHLFDPDYETRRPSANADVVNQLWAQYKAETHVLDYGGGNDVFCAALRANGFPVAVTYDPMVPERARRPDRKFNLVTCFETLEHLPDPLAGIAAIVECVSETGLIYLSTLVQPAEFSKYGTGWWYVGPRNGHISIFSRQALVAAWGRFGYRIVSFDDDRHLAFRTLPPFLAHLEQKLAADARHQSESVRPF